MNIPPKVALLAGGAVSIAASVMAWQSGGPRPGDVTSVEPTKLRVEALPNPNVRRFDSVTFRVDTNFDGGAAHLLGPALVRAYGGGSPWVLDWGGLSVKKLSVSGSLVREFGGRFGSRSGELVSPTDFAVADDGDLWILDPRQKRITAFDAGARVKVHVTFGAPALRFLVFSSKRFLLVSLDENLFTLVDSLGHRIRSFGSILERQRDRAIAIQGSVATSGPDEFVYAPLYAGYLGRFRLDGQIIWFRQTVNQIPFPPVETKPSGRRTVPESYRSAVAAYDVAVAGGVVYVLSKVAVGADATHVLDLYDHQDGGYMYSVTSPDPAARSIAVGDNSLYTVSDSSVKRWYMDTRVWHGRRYRPEHF